MPWRRAPACDGHAAAVHAGDDVHARLVAHRLERLADVALQGRAREELVERPAVDGVGTGARPEDDARDGRLALAGRAVARAGGEVDGDRGDRLVVGDVVGVVAVGSPSSSSSYGLSPRSEPSMTRSTSRSAPGISGFWRGAGSSSSSSVVGCGGRLGGSGLLSGGGRLGAAGCQRRRAPRRQRAARRRRAASAAAGSSAAAGASATRLPAAAGSSAAGAASSAAAARRPAARLRLLLLARGRLLRGLLVGGRAVVGHQGSISIGVGFCATCGWSGPA